MSRKQSVGCGKGLDRKLFISGGGRFICFWLAAVGVLMAPSMGIFPGGSALGQVVGSMSAQDYCTFLLAQKLQSGLALTADQQARMAQLAGDYQTAMQNSVNALPGENLALRTTGMIEERAKIAAQGVGQRVRNILLPAQNAAFLRLFESGELQHVHFKARIRHVRTGLQTQILTTIETFYTRYGEPKVGFQQPPPLIPPTPPSSSGVPYIPASPNPTPTATPTPTQIPMATAPPEAPANRSPVPDPISQAKSESVLKDIYPIGARQSAAERKDLAQKLLEQGKTTTVDADAYVMMREARELSAAAGDGPGVCDAVDAINVRFNVDGPEMSAEAMKKCVAVNSSVENEQRLAAALLAAAENAVKSGDFEAAAQWGAEAVRAARSAHDLAMASATAARVSEIQKLAQSAKDVKPAQQKLKTSPDDPQANLIVGKFVCFIQGKWDDGLPLLAKGADADLKSAATADIGSPVDPSAMTGLAEKWWSYGEKNSVRPAKERGVFWYKLALPSLSGLAQTLAEKRINSLDNESVASAGKTHSPVEVMKTANLRAINTRGKWEWLPAGLGGLGECWVEFPAAPRGEYDLEMKFDRIRGEKEFILTFPVGQAMASAWIGGMFGQDSSIEGVGIRTNIRAIENNIYNVLKIHVSTPQPGAGSIVITMNDKPYMNWVGTLDRLRTSNNYVPADPSHLSLFIHGGSTLVIRSMKVTMLNGSLHMDGAK